MTMARRLIELRWHGRCVRCRSELGAGEPAAFDDRSHEITCTRCLSGLPPREPALPAEHSTPSRRPSPQPRDPQQRDEVRRLIADARAALDAARRAS
jgi:hypothetical protein